MDYHHDLSAHHADGSPPLLISLWVFPRRRHGIVKHEDRSLEAEAVRLKVRPILGLIPSPTQTRSPFTTLRHCSYRHVGDQYLPRHNRRGNARLWDKIWLQVENEPQREVSKVVKFAKVCTDTESSVVGLLSMGIVGVMSTLSFLWTMTSSTTICRISFRCSGVDVKGG